jgi:quercetin dioxygenase-like cupin family protein
MKLSSAIQIAWLRVVDSFRRRNRINEDIERAEARLVNLPQVDLPLVHRFAPGVYFREVTMPVGTFIIGQEHRTRHFNVVLSGRARVMIDGKVEEIRAPSVFVSEPGVRKVLFIQETMRWATIHATTETDVPTLERVLVRRSRHWLNSQEMKQLQEAT